jgi:hypothetical protein
MGMREREDVKKEMDLVSKRIKEVGKEWLENDYRSSDYVYGREGDFFDVYKDIRGYFFGKYPVYEELYNTPIKNIDFERYWDDNIYENVSEEDYKDYLDITFMISHYLKEVLEPKYGLMCGSGSDDECRKRH